MLYARGTICVPNLKSLTSPNASVSLLDALSRHGIVAGYFLDF
jgi:hypothetical protein